MGWRQAAPRWLFGNDVFISYARADGSVYAAALANLLSARDFSCYLDQWGSPPDAKLPEAVVVALKRSALLVLLATPRAATSAAVHQELELFRATGRTIIPVDFDNTAEQALWYALIAGLARSNEPSAALGGGHPADQVISRIGNSLGFARRNRRVRWTFAMTGVMIAALGVASVFTAREAKRQETQARAATAREQESLKAAQSATLEAQARAEEVRQQTEKALKASREAQRQQQAAQRSAREALHQQRLAQERSRVARSQELASLALMQLDTDPAASLKLAVEAASAAPTSEAERAVRRALEVSHLQEELPAGRSALTHAGLTRDGRWVLTSEDGSGKLWRVPWGQSVINFAAEPGDFLVSDMAQEAPVVISGAFLGAVKLWDANNGSLLHVLPGHTNSINAVALSPNGALAASASEDGTARLWDVAGRRAVAVLSEPKFGIWHVAFTPDGRHLLTAGAGGAVFAWDARTGDRIRTLLGHEASESILSLALHPKGTHLVTASSDSTARIWDASSWTTQAVLQGHTARVKRATFSPDGRWVATASADGTARIWDWRAARVHHVLRGHSGELSSVVFTADSSHVITGAADRSARLWNVASGRLVREFRGHAEPVTGVDSSVDGKWVLTWSTKAARLWRSSNAVRVVQGHSKPVASAHFSPDGQWILTASEDGTARTWFTVSGELHRELRGHEGKVLRARFSPDNRWLVTAGADQTARLWDAHSGRQVRVMKGHTQSIADVRFNHRGDLLVTASHDGSARIWNVAQGKMLSHLTGQVYPMLSAQFNASDRKIGSSTEFDIAVWDVSTGKGIRLGRHALGVFAFSPSGDLVLTGSNGGDVALWHSADGRGAGRLSGHRGPVNRVTFSFDGKHAVTAGDDRIARVWDMRTLQSVFDLTGHGRAVVDASFSTDGRWILTVAEDSVVRVWDARTGEVLTEFELIHHSMGLRWNPPRHAAEFSPDGRWILATTPGGTAQLIECELCVGIDELLALARTRIPDSHRTRVR